MKKMSNFIKYRSQSIHNLHSASSERDYDEEIKRSYSDDTDIGRRYRPSISPTSNDDVFKDALKIRSAVINNVNIENNNQKQEIYDPSIIFINSYRCTFLSLSNDKKHKNVENDLQKGKLLLLHNEIMFRCSNMPSKIRTTIAYNEMKTIRIETINRQKAMLIEILNSNQKFVFFNFFIPPQLVYLQVKHLRKKFLKYYYGKNYVDQIQKSQTYDSFAIVDKRSSLITESPNTMKPFIKSNLKNITAPVISMQKTRKSNQKTRSHAIRNPPLANADHGGNEPECQSFKVLMSKYTTVLALFLIFLLVVLIAYTYVRLDELHNEIMQYSYLQVLPD